MARGLIASAKISIAAPASRVWQALTDPEQIRQYLFGTEAESDWKVGSPIVYRGVWEGKAYEDKGRVVESKPGELLVSTYWSSMSGTEDKPENYATVGYALREAKGSTELTITQDNCKDEESRRHSASNWEMVLGGIKKLVEGS